MLANKLRSVNLLGRRFNLRPSAGWNRNAVTISAEFGYSRVGIFGKNIDTRYSLFYGGCPYLSMRREPLLREGVILVDSSCD